RAIAQSLDQRLAIRLGAQRRVHLEAVGVEAANLLVGEAEMVWRRLAGDLNGRRLGGAYRFDRLGRGEVLDVDAAPLVAGERGVAGDRRRLGDRRDALEAERGRDRPLVHDALARQLRVLLVEGDRAAAEALVLQRPAQKPGAADRQAVVAEAEGAGVAQGGHLGQLLASHALAHRGEEADLHRGRLARRAAERVDVA